MIHNAREEPCGRVVIASDAKPFTAELFAQAFYGMSFDALVKAMRENRGGQFDAIYKKEGNKDV